MSTRSVAHQRIMSRPDVCHGQACVAGTRIPVHQIVGMLGNGDTIDELLEEFPALTYEDVLACLHYAASLAEEQFAPLSLPPGPG